MQACLKLDVDLIYFDLSKPLPCKLVVIHLRVAIKRGIHFEIDYNPALRGAGEGRTVFFAASQSKQQSCRDLHWMCIIPHCIFPQYLLLPESESYFSHAVVCKALKGRNVVISSRARNAFELRSPYDVINFAALLGLKESDAKVAPFRSHHSLCMAHYLAILSDK